MKRLQVLRLALAALAGAVAPGAAAQDALDRTDPARQERALPTLPARTPSPPVIARPDATADAIQAQSIFARDIRIEGLNEIPPDVFDGVIADYRGRRLDMAELRALAGGLAERARARGYPFASAWVPAQTLAGRVLTVRLDEGRVDEVRLDRDDPAVARILAPLADGTPVRREALERLIMLAGDIPGVRLTAIRLEREGERGILRVAVERERVRARLAIDNYATEELGPVRARARLEFASVLAGDDRVTVESVVTPFDTRELWLAGGGYEKGLGPSGAIASLDGYYTQTRPGGALRERRTRGESWRATAGASYPLVRARDASIWLRVEAYRRESRQWQRGEPVRDDAITGAALELAGVARLGRGWLSSRITATRGLGLFDITREGDPLASRRDGDARFTKFEAYAAWTGAITGPLGLKLAAEGQLASRPLLSSEEFGIGGPRFGRAFDYSEEQGDEGIAGLAELRYDLRQARKSAVTGMQLYAFADGGLVRDRGRRGRDTLSSAGAGVRVALFDRLDADFEIAVPLSGGARDRSPRFGVELRARF